MLDLVAERTGHAAAAGRNLAHRSPAQPREQLHRIVRSHDCFLMAVAVVEQCVFGRLEAKVDPAGGEFGGKERFDQKAFVGNDAGRRAGLRIGFEVRVFVGQG